MLFSKSIDIQYIGYINEGFMATVTPPFFSRDNWVVNYGVVYPNDVPKWCNIKKCFASHDEAKTFCKKEAERRGYYHMISNRDSEQLTDFVYRKQW